MEDWIPVILEEYKTLRAESLQAMSNQLSILNVGTGAVGVLLATGFGLWKTETLIAIVIFLFFAPIVCYLSLIIWIGEVERMMRVGKYISELETRISSTFKEKNVLNWENYLRTKSNTKTSQLNLNYIAIIFLFFSIACISIVIGGIKTKEEYLTSFLVYMIIAIVVFFVVASHIIISCLNLKKN